MVRLQEAVVRFTSVRGFGDVAAAEALLGKTVVAVKETTELVPGSSRITKCFFEDADGGDEISVVCGVRPSGRAR